jgi:hypothetical protein
LKLISGYIRSQINKYLAPHVLDATLTKKAAGTRAPDAQAAGTNPTSTAYSCRGFVKAYKSTQIDNTLVKTEDREVAILGGSLDAGIVPQVGDTVAIEDPPGSGTTVTFRLVGGKDGLGVRTDPDGAVYKCHARK